MTADPRHDHTAHLDSGGCRVCKTASVLLAAVALVAAIVLIIAITTGTTDDAAFYSAVVALIIPAYLAVRIRGWHQTRLYIHRARDESDGQEPPSPDFAPFVPGALLPPSAAGHSEEELKGVQDEGQSDHS